MNSCPRVLVYNLKTLSDKPVSIIQEHKAGVFAIKFSPSGKYLASLGDALQDGFLHIWAVDQRSGSLRMHSTNKCTNFVRDLAWIGEHNLVTYVVLVSFHYFSSSSMFLNRISRRIYDIFVFSPTQIALERNTN